MIKFLSLILVFLVISSVEAQVRTLELMKLGLPPALASKIGAAIGDASLDFAATTYSINANTVDGSDTSRACVSGGGSCNAHNRGSYIYLDGADLGGASAGDAVVGATDDILFYTSGSGTLALTLDQAQAATFAGTLSSSRTTDLGWAIVDGADNTACTSICTSAAVFGLDLSGGATAPVIKPASDATADICLCAGAS